MCNIPQHFAAHLVHKYRELKAVIQNLKTS